MTKTHFDGVLAYRLTLKLLDLRLAFGGQDSPTGLPPDDRIYRVELSKHTGKVQVMCLGIETVDNPIEATYNDVSELPMWAQEKLSVLMMLKVDPPMEPVDGVGIRINNSTFWLFTE
jgi:hypothetical protein